MKAFSTILLTLFLAGCGENRGGDIVNNGSGERRPLEVVGSYCAAGTPAAFESCADRDAAMAQGLE